MRSCSNKGNSGHDESKTVGIVGGYVKGRCLLSSDMFLVGWQLGRDYSFGSKCMTFSRLNPVVGVYIFY